MPCTALPIRKALTSNSTAADFATAPVPTTTEPVHSEANGIFNLYDGGLGIGVNGRVPQWLLLLPYGGNASDDIFNMRVYGWSKTALGGVDTIWVPQLLAQLQCTLGSTDWSAGLGANMKPVDTITATYGITDEKTLGVSLMSPANELPACAWIHLRGCEKIQFDFDRDTGGDAANCFWRAVDGPH